MKNPLHRKKLQLALTAFTTKVREKSSELDYIWVTRKTLSSWINCPASIFQMDKNHEAKQKRIIVSEL